MAELKPGWIWVRFGDVVRLNTDRCADPVAAGIERYVGLEHIEPEDLRIRRWGLVEEGTTFTNRFRPGQVLFGKRRAYQRKVAVADFEGVCSSDIYVFEPKDDRLLPELLPFLCQTEAFYEHAVGTSAGSLSPRTNWAQLANYEFALPPLEEQWRIVSVLEPATRCVSACGQLYATAYQLRMSTAKSILSRVDGRATSFGDVPTDWDFLPIKDVTIESSFGPRFSSAFYTEQGRVKAIRTTDFAKHGRINFDSAPIADLSQSMVDNHRLEDGDFLLSRSGEYAGLVRVFRSPNDSEFVYIPAAFLIRFRLNTDRIMPQFLFELFESPRGASVIRSLAQGSAQPNISGSAFLKLEIPIPPLEEQQRICANLEALRQGEQFIDQRQESTARMVKRLNDLWHNRGTDDHS
jgi:type I restriction enzyme S subunit